MQAGVRSNDASQRVKLLNLSRFYKRQIFRHEVARWSHRTLHGKRRDGLTIIPWQAGRPPTWNVTVGAHAGRIIGLYANNLDNLLWRRRADY
jgi:hypothetical protein